MRKKEEHNEEKVSVWGRKETQTSIFSDTKDNEDQSTKGKISNTLSKAIASEREPDLFDSPEVRERDEEIKKIQEIIASDKEMGLDRRGKPIFLTSYQSRIIHALSYGISQEATAEDVKNKIQNPFKRNTPIIRNVNITSLAKLIFGSSRKRYTDIVKRNLIELSHLRQYQIIKVEGKTLRLSTPLLQVGKTIEEISKDEGKLDSIDVMEITFGSIFFSELDKRFAIITPKLFEVWSKKGRATELFSVLLDSLLSVYWQYRQAANKAEERIKKSEHYKNLSKEEKKEEIGKAKRQALTYELNITSIKKRVTINYDSSRQMQQKFKKSLRIAIDGFKELGLITEAKVIKGAKGQSKIYFIFNEKYTDIQKKESVKLLGISKNSGGISAF